MPTSLNLDAVRAFERELDAGLASLSTLRVDANECLGLVSNLCESAYDRADWRGFVGLFERGANIVARFLVSGATGAHPGVESVVRDLMFASHYYLLRDYLYFTYNAPGSMSWQWADHRVEVRFADATIPRQYYTEHNNWMLDSCEFLEGFEPAEIEKLLHGESEFVMSDNIARVHDLIGEEADLKLRAYFSVIDRDSDMDLGGYSYAQFITFYRALVVKALYHRHFARANSERGGAVFVLPEQLLVAAEEDMPRQNAEKILRDVVLTRRAPRVGLILPISACGVKGRRRAESG